MRVECTCQRCGEAFFVHAYRASTARYCSYLCANGPRVYLTCEQCGNRFSRNRASASRARFCSYACMGACRRVTPEDNFWSKVDTTGPLPESHPEFGSCWLWTAGTTNGYGSFAVDRREVGAHKFAYRLRDEIAPGLFVCHTCDIRLCVRNDEQGIYVVNGVARPRFGHLFLGTRADNSADMWNKGRGASGDHHMSRTRPEALLRGDRHPARRNPDLMRRAHEGLRAHPERLARGEHNGSSRLNSEQVVEIRRRWGAGGVTQAALGLEYGVSQSLIGQIVRGRAWKHLL